MHPAAYVPGITYAIHSDPFDGWVKIGRTGGAHNGQSPLARLRAFQTGNHRTLVLGAIWPVDAEADLHRIYAEYRGLGEWFALPLALVECMAEVADSSRPVRDLLIEWPASRVRSTDQPHTNRTRTDRKPA